MPKVQWIKLIFMLAFLGSIVGGGAALYLLLVSRSGAEAERAATSADTDADTDLAFATAVGIEMAMRVGSVTATTSASDPSVNTGSAIPELTPTVTSTTSATSSVTEMPTVLPTQTLSTLVLRVTSVNRDVVPAQDSAVGESTATPSRTDLPNSTPLPTMKAVPTLNVPTPAVVLSPLPLLFTEQLSTVGWVYTSVADPAIERLGRWALYTQTYRATDREYLYSNDDGARLRYRFLGAAVRVHYIAFHSYGVFQIVIDGQIRATIDSYQSKTSYPFGNFLSTEVYALSHGWHTLEIVHTGRKAPTSAGTYIAVDAIDIYLNGAEPTPTPTLRAMATSAGSTGAALPAITVARTDSPRPARHIAIVAAPPTVRPTATDGPPAISRLDFSAAYDLNNNKIIDTLEGIEGLSVRLVRADTNELLAAGTTDVDGFLHLEATSNAPLRLVVPYFGKYWEVPRSTSSSATIQIRLIIPAANQPGLIP